MPTKSWPADHWRDNYRGRDDHRAGRDHHPVGSAIAEPISMRPGAATPRGPSIETREGE